MQGVCPFDVVSAASVVPMLVLWVLRRRNQSWPRAKSAASPCVFSWEFYSFGSYVRSLIHFELIKIKKITERNILTLRFLSGQERDTIDMNHKGKC